ncbi:hypothetical protein Dip510_001952 [Elusimicrobium posterum]|uniref:hypothetical protein n=1 Tax=Elusimicrobium posterum TaxID=3116653 RepID=UPI003C756E07
MKKVLVLLLSVFFMAGCATFGQKKDYAKMTQGREVPIFFGHGESLVVFDLSANAREVALRGTAMIRKTGYDTYSIKLTGPMVTNIVDAVYENGDIRYRYILPDINSGAIKNRFERFIRTVIIPPGEVKSAKISKDGVMKVKRSASDGKVTYFYNEFARYPSAMQSGSINVEFLDYNPYLNGSLPYTLRYSDNFAEFYIEVSLVSIRN